MTVFGDGAFKEVIKMRLRLLGWALIQSGVLKEEEIWTHRNIRLLACIIGLLGLSPKQVGDDIAKATCNWKGLRIKVKLTI